MPKTIIFANGVPTERTNTDALIDRADTIICADGGTLHALAMGVMPHLIIGDMDSLPKDIEKQFKSKGVKIQRHPAKKDQTDLELAIMSAVKQGATEIVLLTALGGRLDQTLANILLLTRPEWQAVRFSIIEGMQHTWLVRGPDALTLTGNPGDTLSIIPLSTQITGLDIDQVQWPLQNTTVSMGSTHTISNKFLNNEAIIRLSSGVALVIQINMTDG